MSRHHRCEKAYNEVKQNKRTGRHFALETAGLPTAANGSNAWGEIIPRGNTGVAPEIFNACQAQWQSMSIPITVQQTGTRLLKPAKNKN